MKSNRILLSALLIGLGTVSILLWPSASRNGSQTPAAETPAAAVPTAQVAAPVAPAPAPAVSAPTSAAAAAVVPPAGGAAPAATVFEDFARWVGELGAVRAQGAPVPDALVAEGRRLAEARRPVLRELMQSRPYDALAHALRWHEWTQLPPEVQALVETPFSRRADFTVLPDCRVPEARTTPWQAHEVTMEGVRYQAFPYGRRSGLTTKLGTPLQGITLDNLMALWESPAYVLAGEELAAARQLFVDGNPRGQSWLTGQPVAGDPRAALVGGKLHYFANDEELATVAQTIARAEQQNHPRAMEMAVMAMGEVFNMAFFQPANWQPASAWTEQPKRVLAMRLAFSNAPVSTPYNLGELSVNMAACSNSLRLMSYGKTWLNYTVTPTILVLLRGTNYYATNGSGAIAADARAVAAAAGYVLTNYDIFVYTFPSVLGGPNYPYLGQATLGGPDHWVNGRQDSFVSTHEFGHNYGLGHANFWRSGTGKGFAGAGANEHEEYGDPYDYMGNRCSTDLCHYSMRGKSILNWIEPGEVLNVTTSGVYRIRRFDDSNARATPGGTFALRVAIADGNEFWIGYRRATGLPEFNNGAYVLRAEDPFSTELLDMTPASQLDGIEGDKRDAALTKTMPYTDPSKSVRFTQLGQGGVAPNEYIDVDVTFLTNPAFELFTTGNLQTNGLIGSYVNANLAGRAGQEDWRSTAGVTISGTRVDSQINFTASDWGNRAALGLTGGTAADWDNFSVQWDGWIVVHRAISLATRSDDGSRLWVDVNNNNSFAATRPEFFNNNFTGFQGSTVGERSQGIPPGTYRIRIQYQEAGGGNLCQLVATPVLFEVFTDTTLRTNGLYGSYVNSSLRARAIVDDWRTSQPIAGRRIDVYPGFPSLSWGARAAVGLTGGDDGNWENYSVQWDGQLAVYAPTYLSFVSDDGSRLFLDSSQVDNNWGLAQGENRAYHPFILQPGGSATYPLRVQFESGVGYNVFYLEGQELEYPGPSGYSLYFNGTFSYAELPNASASLPTDEVTVEFWQRAYEAKQQFSFALVPDQSTNRFSAHVPWSTGQVFWDYGDISTAGRLTYTPPQDIVGRWEHWALVSSRAGNYQRIYRNGVLIASDATAGTFVRSAGGTLRVGRGPGNEYFHGEMDEFRIWSVARSEAQIRGNMTCRVPAQSGLWAYWSFDDLSGGSATDLSGNGRHLNYVLAARINSTIPDIRTGTLTNVVTTLADSGPGSLRQILLESGGADCPQVITFGVTGTITVSNDLPVVTAAAPVTILGPGTNALTLQGGGGARLLQFGSGTTNRIVGLTLARGFSTNHGAALANSGRTVVENCLFVSNTVTRSFGGAVCNGSGGTLLVTNCVFSLNTVRGGDGMGPTSSSNGGPGGGGAGMGGAIFSEGTALTLAGCTFLGNCAVGGNGGPGDRNGGSNGAGYNGGFPNGGLGGAVGQAGGAGGFGGGGGGGAGSAFTGFAGGAGGFGGGGGAGGARGFGDTGGAPGAGGLHGGSAGPSLFSHSGGGGGGAGLGGALFTRTGAVAVVGCSFTGNCASNGVGGVGSFGAGNGANGEGAGGALFNLGATLTLNGNTYSDNSASTGHPDLELSTVVTRLADGGFGSLRQALLNAALRPGPDTVTFDPQLSGGTIALATELVVTDTAGVLVTATNLPGGLGVNGGGAKRVFNITGGAILMMDSLTVSNSYVGPGSQSPGTNGGAFLSAGQLTLRRCTISWNNASRGAGIYAASGTGLVLEHCTLYGNFADDVGGVIYAAVPLEMRHCTVVNNRAINASSGVVALAPVTIIENSILAGNLRGLPAALQPDDLTANVYLQVRHNLIGNGPAGLIAGNGNLTGSSAAPLDPVLGPLQLNGGSTFTLAPRPGSPAIDAGDPSFEGVGATDQRGSNRVNAARLDIGAVESIARWHVYYPVDTANLFADALGGSALTYQGNGPSWFNADLRGQTNSASFAINDRGFGTNNYYRVTTAHDPTNSARGLGLQGDFTVSAWVLPTALGGWKVLLGGTGPGSSGHIVFGLLDNTTYMAFWNNDIRGSRVIPVNTWTHLAFTYRQHGGEMAIYVNGQLDVADIGRPNTVRAGDVLLGFSEAIANSYFQGFVDEFAIHCSALSANQIQALANPSITPTNALPAPAIAAFPTTNAWAWNVREIHSHPVALWGGPQMEAVATAPQLGIVSNYTSLAINRYDPQTTSPNAGFLGGDVPWANNNLTPQGKIDGNDDSFVLAARARLVITNEDDYTFGFNSDDGARLRVIGAWFRSSSFIGDPNYPNLAVPAHRGDLLVNTRPTGSSGTLGVTHLLPGTYDVEFLACELGGSSHAEVFLARGAKTAFDSSFRLLTPGMFQSAPSLAIQRLSPSQARVTWTPGTGCLEAAPSLSGPWTVVSGATNGAALSIQPGQRYFRVAQ